VIDIEPATRTLTNLIRNVRDDQLGWPTPCSDTSVADLIDHVDGLSRAFTAAATKAKLEGDQRPTPDGSRLGTDWRPRLAQRLATLAQAWDRSDAWTGMTQAGGQDLPGELAGVIALNEVLVHGWDIAVASGQSFTCKPDLVEAALQFVQPTAEQNPDGTAGLFGPAVPVPEDAPALDRLLALTGRDPAWSSPPD
jgi:uncharacterized protein (TIGR03086 family)